MTRKRRQFTREFKIEAVMVGTEGEMTIAQGARDLDIGAHVLQRWKKQFTADPADAFPGKGPLKPDDEKLRQLRLENARLRQECDIINRSAPWGVVYFNHLK